MTEYVFQFVAGWSCLDFINTLGDRGEAQASEHLTGYSELIRWAEAAHLIEPTAARELVRAADARPRVASRTLARALELREALFRIFAAARKGASPLEEDLDLLNRELSGACAHRRVRLEKDGYELCWPDEPAALDRPLWPVVRSAADLLTSGDLRRLKSCASETCNWVFMDESRNRSRQWCQMEVCGNRAKARRHYARSKSRGRAAERRK